jgi:hypothetical protein
MSIELSLSAIAGMILSLVLEYVPGVAGRYEGLTAVQKRLVVLVLLLLSAGALFGLSCADLVLYVECTARGVLELLGMIGVAIGVNQGTYLLTKKA